MNALKYAYSLLWSEEDQAYIGRCTEFPSLSHLAETQPKALSGISTLVAAVLKDMKATGEAAPEPISMREYRGNMMVRVEPALHRSIVLAALRRGTSVNKLAQAALAREVEYVARPRAAPKKRAKSDSRAK